MTAYFDEQKCIVFSKNNKKIIVEGVCNKKNGLYQLAAHNLEIIAVAAHAEIDTDKLWLFRLRHISFDPLHE